MEHKNWVSMIVVLGLLSSSGVVMPQMRPVAQAAPAISSQRYNTDAAYGVNLIPDSSLPSPAPDPAPDMLYPDELDDPETCGVPMRGSFGQDEEILVGPWTSEQPVYRLYIAPSWNDQQPLPGSTPTSDIAAVAQGSEQIVAAWNSGGGLMYNTWSAGGGWSSAQSLNKTPDGNPALLSRNAYNWVVFSRVGTGIEYRQWNYGTLGTWMDLPGVEGAAAAASDPAVVSKDPHHMAVFYRDADGAVWFTEGAPGGTEAMARSTQASTQITTINWRVESVSLSGVEIFREIYLPLVMKNSSGTSLVSGLDTVAEPYVPSLRASSAFTLTSELGVASRNENHLAVFGVDANNQLWVREWTNQDESDWSDTEWVMLMDNVMVERPAVTSRHSNHLGVAVRNTSGVPYYIEWTYAAGWKEPVLLLGGPRSSPLAIAALRIDALAVFSVEGERVLHKDWNETEKVWGLWQEFPDTSARNGQTLTAIARQMDDLMLLGRQPGLEGAGFYKHFTALGQELRESVVAGGTVVSAHPGDQALAWVDGKTLWVGADQDQVMTDTWKIEALTLADGAIASLVLPAHPWAGWTDGKSAMAAGDVDLDGDDEIVIATATNTTPTLSISVLNFAVSPTLVITLTSTITRHHQTAAGPDDGRRLDVAIGDLDGDGRQDEVAITYHLKAATDDVYQPYVTLFEYITTTNALDDRSSTKLTNDNVETRYWSTTDPPMATARQKHTATPLDDGRVLVVGGYNGDYLNDAEVYDPATGAFTTTGAMTHTRENHTATLLGDGRVLVVGGKYDHSPSYRNSAEVYDPATGAFTETGPMTTARWRHTATLLDDGRVLVVGGENVSGYLASAEVYDPATGLFTEIGSIMTHTRAGHTATLLPDGNVLVVGGYNGDYLNDVEVYDPATELFTEIGSMTHTREKHTATLLDDGRVLVVGGYNGDYLNDAEVYDLATGLFTETGSMTHTREKHTATLLDDGRVLVVGGKYALSPSYRDSAEVYDWKTGVFTTTGSMNTARWEHTATLLPDGRVLVAGGENVGGYLNSAEVYNFGISRDLRTTIGKVYDRHPDHGKLAGDQLIIAYSDSDSSSSRILYGIQVYDIDPLDPYWSLLELDDEYVESEGDYWVDLASGDMNADGLEEIVYAHPAHIHVIDYDRAGNRLDPPVFYPGASSTKIVLAVGDVDLDGKAEIAYWTTDDQVGVLNLVGDTLVSSGSIAPTVSDGELLIGDLDDDSFRSDLVGCTSFSELSVIAVLNGVPRVYAGGLPVQDTVVRYAQTREEGDGSSWGTTTNLGGFLSVGFEAELSVPLIGTKLGEVRGSVTQDFMASQGQTRAVEESITLSSGYNVAGQTLGLVVYNGTDYRCYYYKVYSPAEPEEISRAMICQPIGRTGEGEEFCSLEQWHSVEKKQEAGSSWVDVGHRTAGGVRTNDVNTYPSGLPVDPYLLKNRWPPAAPLHVDYDVSGGYTDWSITNMQGGSQEFSRGFETNTTVSAGVTAGSVTVDAGVTVGFGWDQSRSVSWSNELEIGGTVYKVSDPAFKTCEYTVVPYIYHAKATTLAGVTYPYLEMDYYVPSLEGSCTPVMAE